MLMLFIIKDFYTLKQKSLVLLDPLRSSGPPSLQNDVSNFAGTWEAISRIYVPRLFTVIGLQYVRRVANNVFFTRDDNFSWTFPDRNGFFLLFTFLFKINAIAVGVLQQAQFAH